MKTALEAVLQAMVTGGWANESDGDVESPQGAFARVSNSEAEVYGEPGSIVSTFSDVIAMYGMTDTNELIGHFLVREDSQGFVYITSYDNPIALTRDFQQLQDDYALWEDTTPNGND